MTMKEVVEMLKDMGMEVSYTTRKDGGIRVTKIGNQRFTGSKGNAVAREMTGTMLSERRTAQLKTIKTPKGSFGHRKKKKKLEDETIKKIKKIQRLMRKKEVKKTGIVTQQNYRYVLEHYGQEEADRRLAQAERYARGQAYVENVITLILRLKADNQKLNSPSLTEAINLIEEQKEEILESQLHELINRTYEMEKLVIKPEQFLSDVKIILKNKYIMKKRTKA